MIYSDFNTATSIRNTSCQITIYSTTNHVSSGNGVHGNGDDCDNNGDFCIGYDDNDVVNDGYGNDSDDGLK